VSHSAFDNPTFDGARHELTVGGPFTADGPVLGDVTVRFLLIQDAEKGSSDPPLVVHGVGSTNAAVDAWSATVSLSDDDAARMRATAEIRGIAAAVIVRPAVPQTPVPDPPPPDPDPPFIETITWCVSRTVVFR
jgi:hypothetical protein